MLGKGDLCDLTIQTRDGPVRAHSLVLAALSLPLRELCVNRRQLNLLGQSRETVELLVEFAYNGVLEASPTLETAEKLCLLAQRLNIPRLCSHLRRHGSEVHPRI
jgi:hypothetical protein